MVTFQSRHELETIHVTNQHGLLFSFFPNGGLCRAMCGDILINQVLGNPLEGAINNLYLRLKDSNPVTFLPLVGPTSPGVFSSGQRTASWQTQWEDLAVVCTLTLHPEETLWFWTVDIHNLGVTDRLCDVIYAQDLGLAPEATVRLNEAYCSQYIDHHVLSHAQYGSVVCSRQNQAYGERHPWLMQGCTGRATGYVTDGLSFYGLSYKADNIPYALTQDTLANEKIQYEMALCGLQSHEITIAPTAHCAVTFYAVYVPHHPEPTTASDATRIEAAVTRVTHIQARQPEVGGTAHPNVPTRFHHVELLTGHDLTDDDVLALFPATRRHEEVVDGTLLSFFYGDATHVVLKAKERYMERPHGHILRSGASRLPHEDVMSSTTYMYGVFHSHLTIGNTMFHKLLSVARTPLNILKASGQRIFVKRGETYQLLGMPSCYEMGLNACRWFYKTDAGWLVIQSWMSTQESVAWLRIASDQAQEFVILSNVVLGANELDHRGHIDIDAQTATATLTPYADTDMKMRYPDAVCYVTTSEKEKVESLGGDAWLFADQQSRGLAYLTFRTKRVHTFSLAWTGSVLDATTAAALCHKYQAQSVAFEHDQQVAWRFWHALGNKSRFALDTQTHFAETMNDLLYWYLHNAMVHYTIPHGLEQYSGAAWGVRDVCQGPIELLCAMRHYADMQAILFKVFSQQYAETGDWPQWFMFDRFVTIQHPESHGDIIVWPLKALVLYLEATNDLRIFDAEIPYTRQQNFTLTNTTSTLLHHVLRAIDAIEARFLPGTALACYGAGDWNDSLQPADAAMREHMASAWTASLTYQVFQQFATALQRAGREPERERVSDLARRIKDDFHRYLMKDGVVSGFGYFHDRGRLELLMHPSDARTGLQYRLLSMTRGMISEIFSPEQAQDHARLIDDHLTFPDGVRLMNHPVPYKGGVRVLFRRAEEAAHFGREIGLQYVHAHIRYIEAMCKIGHAAKAYEAILRITPIGIRDHVPQAKPRQSNAYFSSSDADVKDRYEAERSFAALKAGQIPVKGGWRIYSSGPGIFINQIIANFLGLRNSYDSVVIDPVLPAALDGLRFTWEEDGKPVTYVFSIAPDERAAVKYVMVNEQEVAFTRQDNPYRQGGAMIKHRDFQALLKAENNIVTVSLS